MATKEELFAAVRTISGYCKERTAGDCVSEECLLSDFCHGIPADWPDPEEGGGEDG